MSGTADEVSLTAETPPSSDGIGCSSDKMPVCSSTIMCSHGVSGTAYEVLMTGSAALFSHAFGCNSEEMPVSSATRRSSLGVSVTTDKILLTAALPLSSDGMGFFSDKIPLSSSIPMSPPSAYSVADEITVPSSLGFLGCLPELRSRAQTVISDNIRIVSYSSSDEATTDDESLVPDSNSDESQEIPVYHSGNVSSSSVNGDIAFLWEWSNFDHSYNPNPLTRWLPRTYIYVVQAYCACASDVYIRPSLEASRAWHGSAKYTNVDAEAGMHTGCLTTAAADTQGQPVLRTTGHADQVTHVHRLLQRLQRAPPCISDRHRT